MKKIIRTSFSLLGLFLYSHSLWAQELTNTDSLTLQTEVKSKPSLYVQDYQLGKGIRIGSPSGDFNMKIRGYVQSTAEFKTTTNMFGSYGDDISTRFRLRRARLELSGTAAQEKVSYRFRYDFAVSSDGNGDENGGLLDAFIAYHPQKNWKITLGQRSTMTDNKEIRISSDALQFIERSKLTSAFSSIRDFGVFVETTQNIGSWVVKPGFQITTGDGQNAFSNYGGLKYGGRVDFLPFGKFRGMGEFSQVDHARQLTPKLIFGIGYSYNDGISSRRGRGSGDIIYLGEDEKTVVLPGYGKLIADFMFKYQGFSATGEFNWTYANIDPTEIHYRVRESGTTANLREDDGLTNRSIIDYVEGRMMLGRGYNIQAGYLFKSNYSIDARFTYLDADKDSFLNNTLYYARDKYVTLAASRYLKGDAVKIQASVMYNTLGEGARDAEGNDIPGAGNGAGEITARLLFQVSF